MIKRQDIFFGAVALSLGTMLLIGSHKSPAAAKSPAVTSTIVIPDEARTPVLVELFTSEGCSDCPPAEDLLGEFEKTQPVPGAEVIALGLHVDYFNTAAWSDRFSSRDFTSRQSGYAVAFRNSQDYTPQMVVDGQAEFVGSDRERAVNAIALAARAPMASVLVTAGDFASGAIPLKVRIDHFPVSTIGGTADVYLAVTEAGLQSDVRGGENKGRTLLHTAVVRKLSLLGVARAGSVFTAQPSVAIEAGWDRSHLRAVVFVQGLRTNRIIGVGTATLP
jgi:hypothetical protein